MNTLSGLPPCNDPDVDASKRQQQNDMARAPRGQGELANNTTDIKQHEDKIRRHQQKRQQKPRNKKKMRVQRRTQPAGRQTGHHQTRDNPSLVQISGVWHRVGKAPFFPSGRSSTPGSDICVTGAAIPHLFRARGCGKETGRRVREPLPRMGGGGPVADLARGKEPRGVAVEAMCTFTRVPTGQPLTCTVPGGGEECRVSESAMQSDSLLESLMPSFDLVGCRAISCRHVVLPFQP